MRLLVVDEEIIAGGVETLRVNLLPELARICESLVWVLPEPQSEIFRDRLRDSKNLTVTSLGWPRGTLPQIFYAIIRRIEFALPGLVARRLKRRFIDARIRSLAGEYRSTHFLTTCVFSQPLPSVALPLAGIVCDVNPVLPAETSQNIELWVKKADAIFGISEFTCEELRRASPESTGKIYVLPLATAPVTISAHSQLEKTFDFFFPAVATPHKGHKELFEACVLLKARGHIFSLALTGADTERFGAKKKFDDPGMENTHRYYQNHAAELDEVVQSFGYVAPEKLISLFEAAGCLVLPSKYEGYGLPLAEAIGRGIPIICTNIPAYLEQLALYQAHETAKVVPAGDSSQLAVAMELQLTGGSPARLSSEDIKRRASLWTWSDVARDCFEVLSELSHTPTSNVVGELYDKCSQ